MPHCELDHIVIAARSLEDGAAHLEEMLGLRVPAGGNHPLMGTHNCLMQIGGGAFLEIIAIDPDAPRPDRPRWYSLDDAQVQARIAERPALLTWVVRTDDIAGAAAASLISPGPIEEGRRGDRVWSITIPRDGAMPEGGLFPTLIEWHDFNGPASNMTDLDCRLEALKIYHPDPERLTAALGAIGAGGLVQVEQADAEKSPGLIALLQTPRGLVEFS
ncbi:MAG: VOC family protein [Alphaproteobacteria bacterium]